MRHYTLHFDGSCGPKNPAGMAAYGYILSPPILPAINGMGKCGLGLGNNYAEFYAVYQGLLAMSREITGDSTYTLSVRGDSKLVIEIMNKKWRAKGDKLYQPAYELAKEALRALRNKGVTVFFDWVPRAMNQQADDLSKYRRKNFVENTEKDKKTVDNVVQV